MRSLLIAILCVLCLASPVVAQEASPDAKELSAKAGQAYDGKRYAEAAGFYVAAGRAGANLVDSAYNAACSYALAGNVDAAFVQLRAAIDAGLDQDPARDSDLVALHADPRWAPELERFRKGNPKLAVLETIHDDKLPLANRYFTARQAVAQGLRIDDTGSSFNQNYANLEQFVGEYDEAGRHYGYKPPKEAAAVAAFDRALDAVPVVLAQAHGRKAVFLNESHGHSQTRASNFAMLAGLRAEGFDVLALEALTAGEQVARTATHCSDTSLFDAGLVARGYPVTSTGYYLRDPVFAETLREALRLGFRLVAYDTYVQVQTQAEREQTQAENLACVFKDDPKARLVVIAGFGHISESETGPVPGGLMAYRFRKLTGIDPLTVDTTRLEGLDASNLKFADRDSAHPAASYVLRDAAGKGFASGGGVDLALYVPAPAHRNDGQPSWLELGGRRRRFAVAASECGGRNPCLVEARRAGEVAEAVPGDRCVVGSGDSGCTLFLAPGDYEIATFDAEGKELARRSAVVPRG
jgi:hypothetical protein